MQDGVEAGAVDDFGVGGVGEGETVIEKGEADPKHGGEKTEGEPGDGAEIAALEI